MNKIEQYLSELPDGYRERALRAYKEHGFNPLYSIINTATTIMYCFGWDDTKEGSCFWAYVHDHLTKGIALPPLPDVTKP